MGRAGQPRTNRLHHSGLIAILLSGTRLRPLRQPDSHNTGERAGAETAELYVAPVHPPVLRPIKELKGFTKVYLAPGRVPESDDQLGWALTGLL